MITYLQLALKTYYIFQSLYLSSFFRMQHSRRGLFRAVTPAFALRGWGKPRVPSQGTFSLLSASSNVLSVDVSWVSNHIRHTHSFLKSFKYFLDHIVVISLSFSESQVPSDPRTMASTFTSENLLLRALARSLYVLWVVSHQSALPSGFQMLRWCQWY